MLSDLLTGTNIVENPLIKILELNVSIYVALVRAAAMFIGASKPVLVSSLCGIGNP
jgi:hypothetical protein